MGHRIRNAMAPAVDARRAPMYLDDKNIRGALVRGIYSKTAGWSQSDRLPTSIKSQSMSSWTIPSINGCAAMCPLTSPALPFFLTSCRSFYAV